MSNWSTGEVSANGIAIHYHRTGGDKPSIVLLHGITDNGLCWTRMAQALESNYDLILVDARGHGHSDKPETGYSADDHAADVAGLIEALGLEKPVVMGHSMGAATATTLGATYPDLVGLLILEDPPWRPANSGSEEERKAARQEWQSNLIEQQTLSQAEIMAAGQERSPNWDAVEFGPWAQAKLQVNPAVLGLIGARLNAWPELIPKLRCPTLLLTADVALGGIVDPETAKAVVAMNDKIDHVHLAGAGHNIRREQFEACLTAVTNFLASQ